MRLTALTRGDADVNGTPPRQGGGEIMRSRRFPRIRTIIVNGGDSIASGIHYDADIGYVGGNDVFDARTAAYLAHDFDDAMCPDEATSPIRAGSVVNAIAHVHRNAETVRWTEFLCDHPSVAMPVGILARESRATHLGFNPSALGRTLLSLRGNLPESLNDLPECIAPGFPESPCGGFEAL